MTEERAYPLRPFVGVGVVVFQADRVLLIRRGKPPRLGHWSLPGGVQEVGETVHEAAHREVREEAGVEVDILGLIDVVDSIRHDAEGRVQFHYTLVDLAAEWRAGDAVAGSDAMDARWVSLGDISGLGLWAETVRIVRQGESLRGRCLRVLGG